MKKLLLLYAVLSSLLLAAGCGVTYPKETLRESVIKVCKDEYKLDIDAGVFGNTLAIYLPIENLFDPTLNLSQHAQEKIQDTLLGASRVVLSTDADIKFYCLITQDVRLPEIQLVVIKYTDDVKRAFLQDISREEYFQRTLIDINENPQAKKEKAIRDVFDKMKLDKEWQEKVLDDFFRTPPSSLEGIGYWNKKFYVKDVRLPEFLAEQIESRVKIKFREKEELKKYALKMISGRFLAENNLKYFLISINAETLLFVNNPEEEKTMEKEVFKNIFEVASDVIYGYKFRDFDLARIMDKGTNARLSVSMDDIYLFKQKKLPLDAILGAVN